MTRKKWAPHPAYIKVHEDLSTDELSVAVGLLERDIEIHKSSPHHPNPKRVVFLEGCYEAVKDIYDKRMKK